ncbi:hypothetical protein FACS1894166_09260 [Bacilli bacterium]|nr:hypothetical protein FACS1894166_09260 [Bacilli bacterium]
MSLRSTVVIQESAVSVSNGRATIDLSKATVSEAKDLAAAASARANKLFP